MVTIDLWFWAPIVFTVFFLGAAILPWTPLGMPSDTERAGCGMVLWSVISGGLLLVSWLIYLVCYIFFAK